MSDEFTCSRQRLEELRSLAFGLIFFESEMHLPEWKDKLAEFLERFFELTTPPPYGPREIADLIDFNISWYLERDGLSLEQAVPIARKSVAVALNKSYVAVKTAHVRYGKQGVAKTQNLPR